MSRPERKGKGFGSGAFGQFAAGIRAGSGAGRGVGSPSIIAGLDEARALWYNSNDEQKQRVIEAVREAKARGEAIPRISLAGLTRGAIPEEKKQRADNRKAKYYERFPTAAVCGEIKDVNACRRSPARCAFNTKTARCRRAPGSGGVTGSPRRSPCTGDLKFDQAGCKSQASRAAGCVWTGPNVGCRRRPYGGQQAAAATSGYDDEEVSYYEGEGYGEEYENPEQRTVRELASGRLGQSYGSPRGGNGGYGSPRAAYEQGEDYGYDNTRSASRGRGRSSPRGGW